MKLSNYNLYLDVKDDIIIFNSLKYSVDVISGEQYNLLSFAHFDKIDLMV